jgi:hypothetical protein
MKIINILTFLCFLWSYEFSFATCGRDKNSGISGSSSSDSSDDRSSNCDDDKYHTTETTLSSTQSPDLGQFGQTPDLLITLTTENPIPQVNSTIAVTLTDIISQTVDFNINESTTNVPIQKIAESLWVILLEKTEDAINTAIKQGNSLSCIVLILIAVLLLSCCCGCAMFLCCRRSSKNDDNSTPEESIHYMERV